MLNQRVFLKNVGYFLGIPACSCMLLFAFLNYKNSNVLGEARIKQNVTSLFIGDSHVKCCINDSIVLHSVNFSEYSESFCFSYYKIQGLVRSNPSISKLYLGFSYHSLSAYYDDYIVGNYSKDIAPNYFFILPGTEKMKFINYNSGNLTEFFKTFLNRV